LSNKKKEKYESRAMAKEGRERAQKSFAMTFRAIMEDSVVKLLGE
jgi:hypothetical protein